MSNMVTSILSSYLSRGFILLTSKAADGWHTKTIKPAPVQTALLHCGFFTLHPLTTFCGCSLTALRQIRPASLSTIFYIVKYESSNANRALVLARSHFEWSLGLLVNLRMLLKQFVNKW